MKRLAREELVKQLTIDMLPDSCREIASIIGIDNTLALCDAIGGMPLYLPKTESVLAPFLRETVRREYNGYNKTALAKKYNLAIRTVDGYVQDIRNVSIPGQISMDDI